MYFWEEVSTLSISTAFRPIMLTSHFRIEDDVSHVRFRPYPCGYHQYVLILAHDVANAGEVCLRSEQSRPIILSVMGVDGGDSGTFLSQWPTG